LKPDLKSVRFAVDAQLTRVSEIESTSFASWGSPVRARYAPPPTVTEPPDTPEVFSSGTLDCVFLSRLCFLIPIVFSYPGYITLNARVAGKSEAYRRTTTFTPRSYNLRVEPTAKGCGCISIPESFDDRHVRPRGRPVACHRHMT